MMSNFCYTPEVSCASDYAILSTRVALFYYGYEVTEGEEWCFEAVIGDERIKIPFSKLGAVDMFDCRNCLMIGVGWIFAKYDLVLNERYK